MYRRIKSEGFLIRVTQQPDWKLTAFDTLKIQTANVNILVTEEIINELVTMFKNSAKSKFKVNPKSRLTEEQQFMEQRLTSLYAMIGTKINNISFEYYHAVSMLVLQIAIHHKSTVLKITQSRSTQMLIDLENQICDAEINGVWNKIWHKTVTQPMRKILGKEHTLASMTNSRTGLNC